jgi:hypothetical protein
MKTTAENNLMICKFMGLVPEYELLDPLFNITYKYHTSWDWLMPVVEEIDHLEYESERLDAIDNAIKTRVIGDVHYAVCKFIEWYNENK